VAGGRTRIPAPSHGSGIISLRPNRHRSHP
jgi:hypothetical protein